jgi:hypothetical protein
MISGGVSCNVDKSIVTINVHPSVELIVHAEPILFIPVGAKTEPDA